jgi:hypothetical protein
MRTGTRESRPIGRSTLPDLAGRAVHMDIAGLDPALQPAAGMIGQQPRQHLVQPVGPRTVRHGYKLRFTPGIFVGKTQEFVVGNEICAGGCIRHGDKSYNQPAMLPPRIRFS